MRRFVNLAILLAAYCALLTTGRAIQVVFTEVMYNPPAGKPEFIEVWNISHTPIDIARWRFTNGINFEFPDFNSGATQDHFLKPLERIIVSSASPAATRTAYPSIPANVRVFGPWTGSLDNAGERITLEDPNGVIACTLSYDDEGFWPAAADGTGHSLVLINENRNIDDWRNWRRSNLNGGSPGLAETPQVQNVAINEIHFAANGNVDWIELHNTGGTGASINGFFLTSLNDFSDKVPVSGTVPARGYLSFDVNFPTDGGEARIFLIDGSNNVLAEAVVDRVPGRPSFQVYPQGSREWYSSTTDTRDAANDPDRQEDIVINEIMADPPSNQRDGEYIELYNRSANPIDISGWRLKEAVEFLFPHGTVIPAGGYLVVGANASYLNSVYSGLNAIGNWDGKLSNSGEMIRLLDQFGNPADIVDYKLGGQWPDRAKGNGSSMELVHPFADNSVASAWKDSDESAKGEWKSFTISGSYVHSRLPRLRFWAVGNSHLVLRNIVMKINGGSNIIANPGVVSTNGSLSSGWLARGTHHQSFSDAEGVHLIADTHGDNKVNHLAQAANLSSGSAELTFEARWVSGKPRLIAQTMNAAFGGAVLVPIPDNLGTPGAPNSAALPDPPPLIDFAIHSPAVPKTNNPVVITAKISSATPLSSVVVFHRADNINNNGTFAAATMVDDGTGADAIANDGIYTAQITSHQVNARIVQFYVRATATNGQETTYPKAGPDAPAMWIVDNQNHPNDLRTMRLIVSEYWTDALSSNGSSVKFNYAFPRLSNQYVPCVLIHNESEIYYNAGVRKSGSPFTRYNGTDPNQILGRVKLRVPPDNPFRGQERLYYDNDSGDVLHNNRIIRYWLYLLGVPANENEFVRVIRNTANLGVKENSEHFAKEMLDRIWENGSDGQFYEIDDTHFIGDNGSDHDGYTDGNWKYNGENPTSYMNSWIPKSKEVDFDFSGLTDWNRQMTTLGSNPNAVTQEMLDRMADTQKMTALAAVRGYAGDWDNLTIRRGKNGYFYQRSTDNRWMLMHWDSDIAFQSTSEQVLANPGGNFHEVFTYFSKPVTRRYMNFFLTEMVNKFTLGSARMNAWLAAEEAASNSYSVAAAKYQTWFTNRKGTVESFIGTARTASFALQSPPTTTSADTINISGTAPSMAHQVTLLDHPEAQFTWVSQLEWTISKIQLKAGANPLTFRMLDYRGNVVGDPLNHNITKTGNTLPVVSLISSPKSLNVALGEMLTLDASGSYDPDGGPLTYQWSIVPASGYSIAPLSPSTRAVVFSEPGIYTLTVTATDSEGGSSEFSRELFVFNSGDFDGFGTDFLSSNFTLENIERRDNYSPSAWYSLADKPGKLVVQMLDDTVKPLVNASPTFPLITRPLPADGDWAIQTEFTPETRRIGGYIAGLYVETSSGGVSTKYTFGLENGTSVVVRSATGTFGSYSSRGTQAFTSADTSVILRIRRVGNQLIFQRRLDNGTWSTPVFTTQPAEFTTSRAGVFVASQSPTIPVNARISFDYFGLSIPGNSGGLTNDLRISEIMYNPAPGLPEFIELTNTGSMPLNLEGVYFENGNPFDQFTFPAITLNPGEFVVVTNNLPLFQATYGTGITVAGQYSGSLDNGGERIVLRDPNGNVILDFTYSDDPPWPAEADGAGKSLIVLAPGGNYNDPLNWSYSVENNGHPGSATVNFPDRDNDGWNDQFEYIGGSNPLDPTSIFAVMDTAVDADGNVQLTWRSSAGRTYTVQYRETITGGEWLSLQAVPGEPDFTSFTDTTVPPGQSRFYRVKATVP